MIDVKASVSIDDNPYCDDWFDLTTPGKILLRTGKVEIGQGILTALVQIAADELDVAPERFEVLSGHTRLGPLEGQTSSSLSLEVTGRAIRLAASALRNVMSEEAAKLLQANPSQVSFVDGEVQVDGRETPLTVWTLAQTADMHVDVMPHAKPKPMSQRTVVGSPMARIDLANKLTDNAFIQDIQLEGMLHGRVVQPPSVTARVSSCNLNAVRQRFPDVQFAQDGSFLGVISTREETAIRAAVALGDATTWSADPDAPADALEALAGTGATEEIVDQKGADENGVAHDIRLTVKRGYVAHASIAPSCAIATWHGEDLEIYSHTQSPHGTRDALGIVFSLDAERHITVIHKPSAGTYGHSGQDDVALDAALLAKLVPGQPVRVVWTRADDFKAAPMGAAMVVHTRAKLDGDRLTHFHITSHSQPHARRPGRDGAAGFTAAERLAEPFAMHVCDDVPMARGGGAERNATPLYDISNIRVAKRIDKSLPIRTSALRGLGAPVNVFALEALMDEAAEKAGLDAVQFRVAHLSDERAQAVILKAAQMANWGQASRPNEGLGIGFAQYKNKSAYCAVIAKVRVDDAVRVTQVWAAADAGEIINPVGLHAQVEGGITQAISWTLKESVELHRNEIQTDSWTSYPILKFSEVPQIDVELLDRPEYPPLGAGETSVGPTVAAIGNAVRNALGMRVCSLPITREAIIQASASN